MASGMRDSLFVALVGAGRRHVGLGRDGHELLEEDVDVGRDKHVGRLIERVQTVGDQDVLGWTEAHGLESADHGVDG